MNSKWTIGIVSLLVVLAALALFSRKSVRAELVIPATPEQVWAVITDPSTYPDWNPILVAVEGSFVEGQSVTVNMKNADGSTSVVSPMVKQVRVNELLNQFGGIPGILTYDHNWILEPVEGGTRVTQYEKYRGIGVLFWNPASVEEAYRQGNLNLSERLKASS